MRLPWPNGIKWNLPPCCDVDAFASILDWSCRPDDAHFWMDSFGLVGTGERDSTFGKGEATFSTDLWGTESTSSYAAKRFKSGQS